MPWYADAYVCVCVFSKTNYSDISKTTVVANHIVHRFVEDFMVNLLFKNMYVDQVEKSGEHLKILTL